MDIQREREVFEAIPEIKDKITSYKMDFINGSYDSLFSHINAWMDGAWFLFQEKAKAQAVPEGFVLVKQVHPDSIVHNQGLGLFKECQVIYGWNGKSKEFKDALNKGFYYGVKSGAKAVLETAAKSQEST